MKRQTKLNVAVVGLSFGSAFVPVYKVHPHVGKLVICDTDPEILKAAGDTFGVPARYGSLEQVLADPSIDAVHLITPIPQHDKQCVQVLEAGKHCACTVPMAITLEGIRKIIDAAKRSGKNYMMMETSVYTRHYFYASDMLKRGELGNIQFLRGAHYQDMEFWPDYWRGLPPMLYSTHAIAPLLGLTGRRALKVHCFGSGKMREELKKQYNNPYPIETAIFDLGEDIRAEVTRSLFHTAKMYTESFNVYGDQASFEWQQIEDEDPVIFKMGGKNIDENGTVWRGRKVTFEKIAMPDSGRLLPQEIRGFTVKSKYFDETNPQNSFEAGGGHGGSHPHMVHEFVSSIIEDRKSHIDEITAANWTAAGICAHESAMRDGAEVTVPLF